MTLTRKTPLKRKATKPKRRVSVCDGSRQCRQPARVIVSETERYCQGHATKVADKLVADYVKARDGYDCQLRGFNEKPCWGPLAWCHLIPKGRYYGTRWEPYNAITGCAGHHMAFDNSPLEKDAWIVKRLGEKRWDALRFMAQNFKPDVVDVIQVYRRKGRATG